MLQTKAAGIESLTDARYYAAKGVQWMGFPLDDAAAGFSLLRFKAMREWVAGPQVVGEFNYSQDAEAIYAVAADLALDAIQLGPNIGPKTTEYLSKRLPCIRRCNALLNKLFDMPLKHSK